MTSSNLDQETRDAIAALAHRLRQRDAAPAADRSDVEPFATEYVMAMRLRGWRPTPAQAAVAWGPPAGRGADPSRHADELAAVREACAASAAKLRSEENGRTAG
ncbi:hypothetical protein [Nonomuraea wenchangensis]|uniref:hypothetical protein n=1 Tax=Nonomuraea wenchangensis TaxID=568860 RepID=UPI003326E303